MNLLDMKYTSSASSLYSNPTLQTNQKQLESRLNSYFQNKQILNKNQSNHQSTTSYKHLFPKPKFNKHHSHSNLENISSNKNISNSKAIYSTPISKQEPNNQNILSKKKLNLMEFKIKQLQQEIELQLQDKIQIFKRNQQIQRQIDRINQIAASKENRKSQNDDEEFNYQLMELEIVLTKQKEKNRQRKQGIQKLSQNKKQETRPKSSCEQKYRSSTKNSISSQSQQMAQLRAQLEQERNNYKKLKQKFQNNRELNNLSSELKRLKKMVEKQGKSKKK